MPVRSFTNPGSFFEPETVALMSEALEAACKVLGGFDQLDAAREVIARRVIVAASMGERDPDRLQARALAGLDHRMLHTKAAITHDATPRRLNRTFAGATRLIRG
jgi:hypothetical protein